VKKREKMISTGHTGRVPPRWRKEVREILISDDAIARRIRQMARTIARDFSGCEMVVVSLLNGTVMFLADLIRNLSLPLRLDFIGVSSYRAGTESGELVFTKELRLDVRGRDVLLVDDILDTGRTLDLVLGKLTALNPERSRPASCSIRRLGGWRPSRPTMSVSKFRTCSSSAMGSILGSGIETCPSSACCIHMFIGFTPREFIFVLRRRSK